MNIKQANQQKTDIKMNLRLTILPALILFTVGINFSTQVMATAYSKPLYISGKTDLIRWETMANGQVPREAYVAANNEQGPVYICQARTSSGVLSGQVLSHECVIADNGKVVRTNDFQVLVNHGKLNWYAPRDMYRFYSSQSMGVMGENSFTLNAPTILQTPQLIIGGFFKQNNYYVHKSYICRSMYGPHIVIGTMTNNKCSLVDHDKVVTAKVYQVLGMIRP